MTPQEDRRALLRVMGVWYAAGFGISGAVAIMAGWAWYGAALLAAAMLGLTLALLPGLSDETEEL